ncbi:F-box/LRR-repeat protein 4 [Bradysia coprophila]|uniref:F-box/LRR-repeat protein 4 n=1 Tax=Bradysia coprophila TaxID=38358 RepID=UPI00187D7E1D|nr:F-box/LRR-repeat protein 4 [Bradysia coprophila]XP_037030838.1 F-box/LRR-repeat protein 4 [Bradysia coprophila]
MFRDTDYSQSSSSDDYSTSDFTSDLDQNESDNNQNIILNQYVQEVIDFTSQYGSNFSISYTAFNIIGRPSKYPDYGDYPETFAMRTYGKWWEIVPSTSPEIMPQTIPNIISHDFIILKYEEQVLPEEITIFETYNPGAVIKIWAYTVVKQWICLWEQPSVRCPKFPRMFSPKLKKINVPTNTIRIEFNHSNLDYFTEIDAVLLTGIKCNPVHIPKFITLANKCNERRGPISRKLESVQFKPIVVNADVIIDFLVNDFESFIIESGMVDDEDNAQFTLKDFPSEILFKICSYLDLQSLFQLSEACVKLHQVAVDPLLYTEVNLRPYWNLVNSDLLETLGRRCKFLKKLDMSWCGCSTSLNSQDLIKFLRRCGSNLTHLKLSSVSILNGLCVETIGRVCQNLTELSIRNFPRTEILSESCLEHFKNLERLDLFRSNIELDVLLMVLKNNPKLKHLNLAFSELNMDEVSIQIANCNPGIISIDMWKSHALSSVGLLALSNCTKLEEVDFGWCLREEATPSESLKALVKGCPNLKKLFFASIRGLTDRDLENIAIYCENLEQLDLMGVMGISTDKCYEILTKCTKLKLIDLSFCDHLDDIQLRLWQQEFRAHIKRGFVPSDLGN